MEKVKIKLFGQEAYIFPQNYYEKHEMESILLKIYPFEVSITLIGIEGHSIKPNSMNPVYTPIDRVIINVVMLFNNVDWSPDIQYDFLQRLLKNGDLEVWIITRLFNDLEKEALKLVGK